jgi:hypothetical protein
MGFAKTTIMAPVEAPSEECSHTPHQAGSRCPAFFLPSKQLQAAELPGQLAPVLEALNRLPYQM